MITASEFLKWLAVFNVMYGPNVVTIPVTMGQGGTGAVLTPTNNSIFVSGASEAYLLPSANNGVLVTGPTGTPSISTTLPSGITVPGYLPLAGGTMSGAIAMGAHAITGLLNPVAAQDAMTLNYAGLTYLALAGGTMAGNIAMGMHAVTGLLDPVNPQDAMTLNYATETYLELAGGTMTGAIAMGAHAIMGVLNPVNPQDAMTLNYAGLTYLGLAGGTMTGAISMGNHQINSLLDPTSNQDAATKNYVDTVAAGLEPAGAVDVATTTNFASTYNNGASGVGATLTATSTGVNVFDGFTVVLNDRVLFKNQADPTQNGIYVATTPGAIGVAGVYTRSTDYDSPAQVNATGIVPVINGSTQAGQGFYEINDIIAIGTTPFVYVAFGNTGTVTSITAGTGLSGGTITSSGTIALVIPVVVSSGGTGLTAITAHNLMIGAGTSAANLLAPSATSGVPIISQGSSSDPIYGTVVVAGGGTGLTAATAHNLMIGNGTSAFTLLAPNATTGIALVSQGSSSDPAYSTVVVGGGGTGLTTTTAYGLITGGTTATGAFQNAGTGTLGQVFVSQGASALGQWQNVPAATLPAGTLFNFQSTNTTTTSTVTSTATFADVTGLSVAITPTNSSNQVLVRAVVQGSATAGVGMWQLVRTSTPIGIGAAAGSRQVCGGVCWGTAQSNNMTSIVLEFLDTPSTTSAVTYKVQQAVLGGAGSVWTNQSWTDTNSSSYPRTSSTISVAEVQHA